MIENGKINQFDRTAKNIVDVLTTAFHVPTRDVCVLNHDNYHFKAYVHGKHYDDNVVRKAIISAWNVNEDNITIERSPKCWWPLGSTGHVIEVTY